MKANCLKETHQWLPMKDADAGRMSADAGSACMAWPDHGSKQHIHPNRSIQFFQVTSTESRHSSIAAKVFKK